MYRDSIYTFGIKLDEGTLNVPYIRRVLIGLRNNYDNNDLYNRVFPDGEGTLFDREDIQRIKQATFENLYKLKRMATSFNDNQRATLVNRPAGEEVFGMANKQGDAALVATLMDEHKELLHVIVGLKCHENYLPVVGGLLEILGAGEFYKRHIVDRNSLPSELGRIVIHDESTFYRP